MIRIHHLPFWLAAVGSATLAIVACSSSDDSHVFGTTEEDAAATGDGATVSSEASTVDSGEIEDAGDAGVVDSSPPDKRPPFDPTGETVTCTTEPCPVDLVAGDNHFCARMSDGTVRCWGSNAKGNLGVPPVDGGTDAGVVTPFIVSTVADVAGAKQIAAGGTTTCAVLEDGSVKCWGGNDKGQLGLQVTPAKTDTLAHPAASVVAITGSAASVVLGPDAACARLATGEYWCWGNNANRQIGRVDTVAVGGPALAAFDKLVPARLVMGGYTNVALDEQGTVLTWGTVGGNGSSVAGRFSSVSPDLAPLSIGVENVTSISVSSTTIYQPPGTGFPRPAAQYLAHACAITKGNVYCWGQSNGGALATGLPDPAPLPTPAPVISDEAWPQQVTAGGELTCLRMTNGSIQCSGDDSRGALGRGADAGPTFSATFTEATEFKDHAVQVVASKATICALIQGGKVACWGSNEQGELGQGKTDTAVHPSPVPVGF